MISANLATIEDLQAMEQRLMQHLQPPDTTFLTITEAAELTRHSERSVYRWISEGKRDMNGKIVRLNIYKFTESDCRIRLKDLLDFGDLKKLSED